MTTIPFFKAGQKYTPLKWSEKTATAKNHQCQSPDKPSRTVLKSWHSLPKEAHIKFKKEGVVRKLTLPEIATIQSFDPKWFDDVDISLAEKIQIIGNAVPPLLAQAVFTGVASAFHTHVSEKTCLELFAGGGGLAQGIRNVKSGGFKTLAMIDFWDKSHKVLIKNKDFFDKETEIIHADVSTYDFTRFENKINVLSGGPPCQPFSTAKSSIQR